MVHQRKYYPNDRVIVPKPHVITVRAQYKFFLVLAKGSQTIKHLSVAPLAILAEMAFCSRMKLCMVCCLAT